MHNKGTRATFSERSRNRDIADPLAYYIHATSRFETPRKSTSKCCKQLVGPAFKTRRDTGQERRMWDSLSESQRNSFLIRWPSRQFANSRSSNDIVASSFLPSRICRP